MKVFKPLYISFPTNGILSGGKINPNDASGDESPGRNSNV